MSQLVCKSCKNELEKWERSLYGDSCVNCWFDGDEVRIENAKRVAERLGGSIGRMDKKDRLQNG